jgi:hypothetical protein
MVDFTESYLSFDVNWKPVLVAAIANMVIGFAWFSAALFGKPWMRAAGKTMEDIKRSAKPRLYVVAFLGGILAAYVLAVMAETTIALTWQDGAMLGFVLWLGVALTTSLGQYLFEGRNWTLFFVYNGYNLVAFVVMGAIIGGWTA